MSIKTTSYAAALLASLLLSAVALPVSAFAQTETQAAGPTSAHKAKPPMAKPMSTPDRVEHHITRLHTQLQITPAQQTQWDQFAQVMRDNAQNMDQTIEQRGTGFASMNAADNMQSYAKIAQQHAEDTQKLATAFQTLYASMSDDQKKNADTVFRGHEHRDGHMKK
jgi:periplasmic protein CpxP/Spy